MSDNYEAKKVVVFGAGIAGLSAAHELAERRCKVWVVEPTEDTDRHGNWRMAIGGMARTQYKVDSAFAMVSFKRLRDWIPKAVLELDDPLFADRVERVLKRTEPGDRVSLAYHMSGSLVPTSIHTLLQKLQQKEVQVVREEQIQPQQEADVIWVVRRERIAYIDLRERTLSRETLQKLADLARGLPVEHEVEVVYTPSLTDGPGEAQMLTILRSYGLKVTVTHIRPPEETPPTARIQASRVSTAKQRWRFTLLQDGSLAPDSARQLMEMKWILGSGDVYELHLPVDVPTLPAVDLIRRMFMKNGVTLFVGGQVLIEPDLALGISQCFPGEHGFRFFPSYYRHLRHTLARIPVFETDDQIIPMLTQKPSGRNVIDNLVSTPAQALAGVTTNPMLYPRKPLGSLVAMMRQLRDVLVSRHYRARDLEQFELRLMRYMSTGSARREAEYEDMSWWDYLRGFDPRTGTYKYVYGANFERDVLDSPRVLAAFDGQWGDARTNGNTFLQLLLNQFMATDNVDQVLNAPTTEAWLEHWEQYLRDFLDVTFVTAELTNLLCKPGPSVLASPLHSVEPVITSWSGPTDPAFVELDALIKAGQIDYYVLATDAPAAERLAGLLPAACRVGVADKVQGFVTIIRSEPAGSAPARPRGPDQTYTNDAWDRFQTLTGIQFYFRNVIGLFDGHIYFMDAPSALSSINQQQFWRINPVSRRAPFRGLASVDIGRFHKAWPKVASPSIAGPESILRGDLGEVVWDQIRGALAKYWSISAGEYAVNDVKPDWFHLDDYINLMEKTNAAPYLIPIMCDWQNRPGGDPWDPGELVTPVPLPPVPPDMWQAPWGGYEVHWGQAKLTTGPCGGWVFAGTYLRHFTRMTTMEAANESGRHAVNAILDHMYYSTRPVPTTKPRPFDAFRKAYSGNGDPLDPHAAYIPTPNGDYCYIWDMEKYELVDFVPLRELDDWLFQQGQPHLWDLLGTETIPSFLSHLPGLSELGLPSTGDILKALSPPFLPPGWPGS